MRFCTMTLGCKVNQYETQAIESILCERGFELFDPGEGCNVCIINTCTVTAEGDRKSRQVIRRMKKLEPEALIAVCGCFSQMEPEFVEKLGVDLISGTKDRLRFVSKVEELASKPRHPKQPRLPELTKDLDTFIEPLNQPLTFEELPPGSTATRTRALLKIQDGCDNYCTYCIVPYARGRSRSLPLSRIAEYAKQLEERGYKEIVITGIEISSYGKDFESKKQSSSKPSNEKSNPYNEALHLPSQQLPAAIHTIANSAPNTRLRLGSLDPAILTEEFCIELSKINNLCNHFHLSLQSGCDKTLKRMGRKYSTNQVMQYMTTLRASFKNCGITADLITGFPGETDSEFEQTLAFIEKASFSSMHIFPYSSRPGTKAASFPNQIEKSIKKERARRATAIANSKTKDFKKAQIGKTVKVLFEQKKNGFNIGHSENYIEIHVKDKVDKNSIHNVKIIAIKNDKLIGEVV